MRLSPWLSALALGVPSLVSAAQFYVAVPLPGKAGAPPPSPIQVGLAPTAFTLYMYGEIYHDLHGYLSVTGDPNYDWRAVQFSAAEPLPLGLTLGDNGGLRGMPTGGPSSGELRVIASYKGKIGEQSYPYSISPSRMSLFLQQPPLPKAVVGENFSFDLFNNFVAVGGPTPIAEREKITWSTTSTLPEGVSLHPGGVLSGTPASKTVFNGVPVAIKADYLDKTVSATYTLVVGGKPLSAVQVAAGGSHSCAITTEGGLVCWGNADSGRLGAQAAAGAGVVQVSGLTSGVTAVALGENHSCAVHNGQVKCWGSGSAGQLGQQLYQSAQPVIVPDIGVSVRKLAVGSNHACVLGSQGEVLCWGEGYSGQLGQGGAVDRSPPRSVQGLPGPASDVAAGGNTSCAVVQDEVYCWGANYAGQAGSAPSVPNLWAPKRLNYLYQASQVTLGNDFGCAIEDGNVACWGANMMGQLGDGSTMDRAFPSTISGFGPGVTQITASGYHTCAVQQGAGWCWGGGGGPALGNGSDDPVSRSKPGRVVGLNSGVASISAGREHTCAVHDGIAKCWGRNTYGQLAIQDYGSATPMVVTD